MNTYSLSILPNNINFMPNSTAEEILQNVLTICSTPKFSVPMDRGFGISQTFLDEPTPEIKTKYSAEIIRAVMEQEPRARITSIDFTQNNQGHIYPVIKVRIL